MFASDPFKFAYDHEDFLALTFEITALERCLLPTTNESVSTGRIFENDKEYFSDTHSYRPVFIGAKKDFSKTVGFFGDSITQGSRTKVDGYEAWTHRAARALPQDVSVWNLGMGWSRAYDAAGDGIFLRKAAMCDEVFVCFGVNDLKSGKRKSGEIIEDLCTIKRLLSEKNPDIRVNFLTVPPFGLEQDEERERKKVNSYIKSLPENEVFDIAAILEEGIVGKVKSEYMADRNDAHPNGKAGEAIAEEFMRQWEKKGW